MKKKIKKKKSSLSLPPSTCQIKTLASTPLPLTVKKRRKKIKVHPFPRPIMNL
jgi:hypothetical protein